MGARRHRFLVFPSDSRLFQEPSVSSGPLLFPCGYRSHSASDQQFRKGSTNRRRRRRQEDHETLQHARVGKEDLP